MAKGNLFLSQARGRLGSVVFYRANGEQISRAYTNQVSNPRSEGQQEQRAIFSTVSKAAAVLRPIVDHAFFGVKYGTDSMREFRRLNLERLKEMYLSNYDVNLSPKNGAFLPNEYIVSNGTLPSFEVIDTDGQDPVFKMGGENTLSSPEMTFRDFKQTYPEIQAGDQLTMLTLVKTGRGTLASGDYPTFALRYQRLVFSGADVWSMLPDSEDFYLGGEFQPSFVDQAQSSPGAASSMFDMLPNGGGFYLGLSRGSSSGIYALALILSRYNSSTKSWNRSRQSLYYLGDDFVNLASVLDTYANRISEAESAEYLNASAPTENTAATGTPALNLFVYINEALYRTASVSMSDTLDPVDITFNERDTIRIAFSATGNNTTNLYWVSLVGSNNLADAVDRTVKATYNKAFTTVELFGDGNAVGTIKATASWGVKRTDGGIGYEPFSSKITLNLVMKTA